jgi:hypothetical protein
MRTQHLTSVAALALLLSCAGCTSDLAAPETPPTAGTLVADDGADDVIAPTPPTAEDAASAVEAAKGTLAAFANPDLTPDQWMAGMYPVLTQRGADDYIGTDPRQIKVRSVTGTGTVLEGATDVALTVAMPTNAGIYYVALSRPSTESAWLADRIRPAGQ